MSQRDAPRCRCPDAASCTCASTSYSAASSQSNTFSYPPPYPPTFSGYSPYPSHAFPPSNSSVAPSPYTYPAPSAFTTGFPSHAAPRPSSPVRSPISDVLQSSGNSPKRRRTDVCPQPPATPSKARKRRKKNASAPSQNQHDPLPAVFGVGPSTAAPDIPPPEKYQSRLQTSKTRASATASDIWYFMRKLDSDVEPASLPEHEPTFTEKPNSEFVGCRLCSYVDFLVNGWYLTD